MRLSVLAKTHPNAFTALGLCVIAVVGIIDYFTPSEVNIAIFYIFPIAMLTWHVGLGRGLIASAASAITWRLANLHAYSYYHPAFYWNAGVKLGFFMLICLLMTRLKSVQTLLKQANAKLIDVQEQEQERLGKQLREGIGHELAGVSDLLDNIRPQVGDRSLDDSLAAIATRCRKVVTDIHQMSHSLCPEILGAQGLAPAIREAARAWQTPHVKIEFTCPPDIENTRLGNDIELTLFRIAQEAVSNATGHAGVETIQLELSCFGDWVMLTVTDDGLAINAKPSPEVVFSMGVMRDRIQAVGGEFTATSPPGQLRIEAKVRRKTSAVHQDVIAASA